MAPSKSGPKTSATTASAAAPAPQPPAPAPGSADPEVEALVDQMVTVVNKFVSIQADLAKSVISRWTSGGGWGAPVPGGDAWVSSIDSIGQLTQGYFTWVQLMDALAGSGWNKHPGVPTKKASVTPGTFQDVYRRVTSPQDADITVRSVVNDDGTPLSKDISVTPTSLRAGVPTDVTMTITPPKGTPGGTYSGFILDAKTGAKLFAVSIELLDT